MSEIDCVNVILLQSASVMYLASYIPNHNA